MSAIYAMPPIPIDWDYFPFMPKVQGLVGGAMALVLILCVLAFIIAGVVLAFAKLSSSNAMTQATVSMLFWVLGVAAAVGASVALVGWASGLLVW